MADYEDLVRRQAGYPIDFIVGQIADVDNPTQRPSKMGPPQLCQDLVLEDDMGRQMVVQFYDVNKGCFTNRKGDRDVEVNFEPSHRGSWIRISNTSDEEKKASLKRVSARAKASQHYKEKRGIQVLLKATARCRIEWLLDEGMEAPEIRRTRWDKKPPRRRVPGQGPPQQEDRMSNGQRRPPLGGGRQGGQRQPPGQQQRQSNGPPPQQQQRQSNGPRQQPAPTGSSTSHFQDTIDRMADLMVWCEVALLHTYNSQQDLPPPRTEWLEGPVMAIQICVKDKMNVQSANEADIKQGIVTLTRLYIAIHRALIERYQQHEILNVPEGFEMFKRVTSVFIGITRNRSFHLGGR